jgi:hypothetical protein
MKRNRLAGIGLAGLLSSVAMVAALNVGCSTDPEKSGTSSGAINGCTVGASCNAAPGTLGLCHTDPADNSSPVLVCNTATNQFQYGCIENGACQTPGSLCEEIQLSGGSPTITLLCTSAGRLIGVSTPDTGVTDSTPADTNPADTGLTDTGTTDTGTLDTGVADSGPVDTGTPDTGAADSGTPDTGTADTGTLDTGVVDTGTADSGLADTSPADTGTTPDTGTTMYPGLVCPASTPSTVTCAAGYGCVNAPSGWFCSTGSATFACQCATGPSGVGWMLPPGADCTRVPTCTFSDAGADTGADTTAADSTSVDSTLADSAVTDSSVADSAVADSSVADTLVSDTASADTSVADTLVSDVADTSMPEVGPTSCAGVPAGELWAIFQSPTPRPSGMAGVIAFDYWIKGPAGGTFSPWLKVQCPGVDANASTASCRFSPMSSATFLPGTQLTSGARIYLINGVVHAVGDAELYAWFNRTGSLMVCLGTKQIGSRVDGTFSGAVTASDDLTNPQNDMIWVP